MQVLIICTEEHCILGPNVRGESFKIPKFYHLPCLTELPCRAGICVLVNDDAGSRERRAFSRQESVTLLQQAHGVRLAHRSRRQKARRPARKFCRTACWRFSRQPKSVWFQRRFHSGKYRNSVPLRELPPQRGPRQFSVERHNLTARRCVRQSFEPDTLRTGSMCSKMMNGGG